MRACLILLLALTATSAHAADTIPVDARSIRAVTTSAAWTRPSEVKGVDRVGNLTDGIAFTSWVGNLDAGAVWVGMRFAGTRYISRVTIIPGCAGSNRTFGEFGRPKTIVLKAGERSATLSVADRRKDQELTLDPPLPAQELRMEVTEHYGGRLPGVCLTELQYHEQTALGGVDEQTREALEAHAAALGTEDAGAAIDGLVLLGPAAIPRLALALRETDETTQHNTLQALHRIGAPSGADALVRYWRDGPPEHLRLLALKALARTGDERGVTAVVEVLQGTDYDLADAAAEMTGAFGPESLPHFSRLLESPHGDVQERTLIALSHIRHPRVVDLASAFVGAKTSNLRVAAARALAGSGADSGLAYLRRLSNDPHPNVRLAVARSVDRFPPGEAQRTLARLLRDPDEFVALAALETLGKQESGIAHIAAYIADDHAPLGEEAISLMAQSRSPEALRVMIEALRRGEARFRRPLREAIAAFGHDGHASVFAQALKDDRLRMDCQMLLVRHPDSALKLIGPELRRDPASPERWLIRTLGRSRAAGSLEVLDVVWRIAAMSTKAEVINAWGYYPAAAVRDRLLEAVRIPDPELQRAAALAASRAGVDEVAPLLARALESGELPPEVAIEGLGLLGVAAAESWLIDNFRKTGASMRVRMAILHACKRLQTEGCLKVLYGATNDHSTAIRHEAMRLLATQARADVPPR